MNVKLIWILLLFLTCGEVTSQSMNNKNLYRILAHQVDSLQGELGNWRFQFEKLPMLCVSDESNNRMRIMTPIVDAEDLSIEEYQKCLEANFHTALDVKYALSDEVMWAVFMHPLKELTKDQVIDALYQVFNATATFGTTYTSTHLIFPDHSKNLNKKPNINIDKS